MKCLTGNVIAWRYSGEDEFQTETYSGASLCS